MCLLIFSCPAVPLSERCGRGVVESVDRVARELFEAGEGGELVGAPFDGAAFSVVAGLGGEDPRDPQGADLTRRERPPGGAFVRCQAIL